MSAVSANDRHVHRYESWKICTIFVQNISHHIQITCLLSDCHNGVEGDGCGAAGDTTRLPCQWLQVEFAVDIFKEALGQFLAKKHISYRKSGQPWFFSSSQPSGFCAVHTWLCRNLFCQHLFWRWSRCRPLAPCWRSRFVIWAINPWHRRGVWVLCLFSLIHSSQTAKRKNEQPIMKKHFLLHTYRT